jgi:hypothetical protein
VTFERFQGISCLPAGDSDEGALHLRVSCPGLVLPFSIFIAVASIPANLHHIGPGCESVVASLVTVVLFLPKMFQVLHYH